MAERSETFYVMVDGNNVTFKTEFGFFNTSRDVLRRPNDISAEEQQRNPPHPDTMYNVTCPIAVRLVDNEVYILFKFRGWECDIRTGSQWWEPASTWWKDACVEDWFSRRPHVYDRVMAHIASHPEKHPQDVFWPRFDHRQ